MTIEQIQQRLDQGDIPFLLTAEQAGMSGGKWKCGSQIGKPSTAIYYETGMVANCYYIIGDRGIKNARYIAETSTWAEKLWRCYEKIKADNVYIMADLDEPRIEPQEIELEILAALDRAGRLDWKEEGLKIE